MSEHDPRRTPPPQQILSQLLQGRVLSKALSVAADLGVADHLKSTPTPVEEIAARVGADPDALYRILRALSAVGVFTESAGRAFALTAISQLLRSGVRGSMRPMARWQNEHSHHAAWGELEYSVTTGKPAFDHVHGVQVFDYFKTHAEVSKIFDEAMGGWTTSVGLAVAQAYDFSDVKHLVDVGGSQGVLLGAVLAKFPQVRGTLFDLPHVIEGARAQLASSPHAKRIEPIAGSFLEGVPKGADAYVMKSIIHDWDDEHCVIILRHCREAMAPGGRVIIVEGIVTDAPEATFMKLLDLEMLVMTTGGRERTETELGTLLRKAGLALTRVMGTDSPMSIVEAHAT